MITDWEIFKTNQPKLHTTTPNSSDFKSLAQLVKDSYISRKQAFNELEHYQKTKKFLGKHPLFKIVKLKEQISALSTPKLMKKIASLNANLSRNRQKGNTDLVNRDQQLLQHAKFVLENR